MRAMIILLTLVGLVLALAACQAADTPLFSATVRADFGEDLGQSFGSLFEVRDASGRVILGAGFPDAFNTCVRTDRYDLQFYVRPTVETKPVRELLPRSTVITHTSLQDLDGSLYTYTYSGDNVVRRWDPAAGKWQDDPILDKARATFGDGFMRVAGKLLVYQGGEAWYDGKLILAKPASGSYGTFYYALGHLFCYFHDKNAEGPFTQIYACPWKPGDGPIDASKAVVFTTLTKSETTFAWGQLGTQVISFSNYGGTYVFEGGAWRVVRAPSPGVSYQVYATLNCNGDLLLGQYPTGRVLKYDGYEVTETPDSPPVQPGVATYSREAQSLMLYRGDLYCGVWPWAELWRRNADSGKWSLTESFFTKPPLTDKVGHPWEAELNAYNEANGTKYAYNEWGHRVCSLGLWQGSLIAATSAKGPMRRDARFKFITDDVYEEYGRVWKHTLPGHLSAPVVYKTGGTELQCVLHRDKLVVLQDGVVRGEVALDPALVADLKPAKVTWGRGLYGRTALKLTNRKTTP